MLKPLKISAKSFVSSIKSINYKILSKKTQAVWTSKISSMIKDMQANACSLNPSIPAQFR